MFKLDRLDSLYVIWAILFYVALIVHFSLRKWAFDAYILKYGWLFYTLCIPAVIVSLVLFTQGKSWYYWIGGVIFLVWAVMGITIEYLLKIEWRDPIRWPIFGPYVLLYLATQMFYWWPVAQIYRPLWYVFTLLFVIATILNVTSH